MMEKARTGNKAAQHELIKIKSHQRELAQRKAMSLAVVRREPELIAPGGITFLAHALIVPSSNPDDMEQHDTEIEQIAMDLARAFEEAAGAVVKDVHTPELARAAGFNDWPGFDLFSIRPGGKTRAIEVKGKANMGDVEVSANEWARAANLRDQFWLYVVYDCATANPRLVRVPDPFGTLLARSKGSMLISAAEIAAATDVTRHG